MNNIFKQLNIDKLTNIYQESFPNYKPSGLGDFIRGSFFLMQFCDKMSIEYEVSFKNHLLHKFLKNSNMDEYTGISDMSIVKFLDNNCTPYINEITKEISNITYHENQITSLTLDYIINKNKKNKYINTMCFPFYNNLNVIHKEYMKTIFEPNDFMRQYVIDKLTDMKLCIGKYNLIHIRCGDDVLIGNKLNEDLLDKIYNQVNFILYTNSSANEEYILISDSNHLKKNIKIKFPSLKINNDLKIVHIGEGTKNTEKSIISLLLDFYFMAYSKNIISYSTYTHGSGLSLWCSKIYDIPYKCYYLL